MVDSFTKRDMVTTLAKDLGVPKADATIAVESLLACMKHTLAEGGRIEIRGFCTISPQQRQARLARDFKTGDRAWSKPRTDLKLVTHARMLARLNNKAALN